jgi:hypothetical protein
MKRFLTVAALGLMVGAGAAGQADAASFAPDYNNQVSKATGGSAVTKTNGWWAVPVVVGGVLLLHHVHRHHHHHRHHYHHRRHRHYH